MSGLLLGKLNSWANFEKCVLEIIILALEMLNKSSSLPLIEDAQKGDSLNRRLDICIRRAILEWEKINETDIATSPKLNLKKQPDLENEQVFEDYEIKKPDFQWEFRDRLGKKDNLNSIFKNYEIECKRLGKKDISGRSFVAEYVNKGILRFTTSTHRYGQFTSSGAMIGYVQDMELQDILNEVNSFAVSASLPEILLSPEGWKVETSILEHRLDRLDVQPTQFDLRHLWLDMRNNYENNASPPVKKQTAKNRSRQVKKTESSKTIQSN
ncbi:hypothetical protein [Anabaena sp. UHCC 0204]|uniref:hypothetical protein n=1 Tax=Anabaena sp. UHCC 0204 TaxID=2590009 RepID=UPI001445A7C6|nr:hypothetical protein [Anabaena sp. UHCC 0204]MTJ08782.1 hypothetical protein [Anabaena sp. UHCC 0204]